MPKSRVFTGFIEHVLPMAQHALRWCVAGCLSVLIAPAAMAQGRGLAIEYTVKVADIPRQLFHVTTEIRNIDQPALELSLPVWTPGWYVIENYAKNISRFRVSEPGGRALRAALVRRQTWRIDTKGVSRITVDFDYRAAVLAANQARIASDYAFFTGTQLFLLPEGHRSRPSVVRFDVPSGWRIASGLDDTADPRVFTAPDYDTLVDQPTLMGQFDVTRFMVDGKPHDFVASPAGAFSTEKTRALIGNLTKLAETQGRIFGGLPYRRFVYFYLFRPAEASATVLEHQNSYVSLMNAGVEARPDEMTTQASHEFFHLWNVKRIRPVEMWPYDYARENETPLLWVSEGFTNYYAAWRGTAPDFGMPGASSTRSDGRSQRSRATRHVTTYRRRTRPRRRGSATTIRLRSAFPITRRGGTWPRCWISPFVTTPAAHRASTMSCGRSSRTSISVVEDSVPGISFESSTGSAPSPTRTSSAGTSRAPRFRPARRSSATPVIRSNERRAGFQTWA